MAPTTDHDDAMREFARALFTDPEEPGTAQPTPPAPSAGNVAPREGSNPTPPPSPDYEMRKFVRDLFDGPSNDLHDLFHR